MKLILSLFLSTLLIGCGLGLKQDGTGMIKTEDKVKLLLNEIFEQSDPGVQYVVSNKESIIFDITLGKADVKNDIDLNETHKQSAFSMTKTLTAIALLQLVESNKIKLDDELSDYVTHPYGHKITIRHLLTHTSGIPNPIPLKWIHSAESHQKFDEETELKNILNQHMSLDSEPGEKYQYSNIGYWLLGMVIENTSNEQYSNYVTKNIFNRVGLTDHQIGFKVGSESNHTKGYLKKWSFMNGIAGFLVDDNVLGSYENNWRHINDIYLNGPAFGGAIGSAKAFSTILQDLLSDNSVLLSSTSKKLLFSPQQLNSKDSIDMTLGWHISNLNDTRYFYKEGGGVGFHSEMRIYPDIGLASVIMVNRTSFNSRKTLSNLDQQFINVEKAQSDKRR